ncbi:MAG: ATP-binding cassette domain-containing protein [Eubacterium sp.]|nr:ATP-binding cassette domain-containing protein [Eubacterium sp.]
MSEAVIELSDIVKSYGKHEVLKGVNMTVNKGDIYGLVGKNGAGKTTLFKVVLGLSEFQKGTLSILGAKNKQENDANRRNIGFFVGSSFFGYLSGRANLDYFRRVKGVEDPKDIDRVLEIADLIRVQKKKSFFILLGIEVCLIIVAALLSIVLHFLDKNTQFTTFVSLFDGMVPLMIGIPSLIMAGWYGYSYR